METGCLVLVVEDDEDIRDVLATVLGESGYSVIVTKNGEEALQLLRSGTCRPCVILLDLRMPVMDGRQFREEQRKDSSLAGIPVVAISGDGDARAFDAAAHLRKPLQFNLLVRTIERFCASRGPPHEGES
jgi:CheY-like chemotaxis protein